jgi:glyoxylase-like metal-dependent hydrolase (beta-lactamase superfamily II)
MLGLFITETEAEPKYLSAIELQLETKRAHARQQSTNADITKQSGLQYRRGEKPVTAAGYTIEVIESAPFGENCYVLWRDDRIDAIVVDPGFDSRSVLQLLDSHARRLAAILNTHGHVDHIAGNGALKQAYPAAPLLIGRNDADALSDTELNLSASFGMPITSPAADRLVDDGETLEVAGFTLEVREIPGHSPGSVIFLGKTHDPPFLLGGDVLFKDSIGRTDLGGDHDQLMSGIFAKLMNLPGDTLVYPGHGPATTIGRELRSNPFVLDYASRAARR